MVKNYVKEILLRLYHLSLSKVVNKIARKSSCNSSIESEKHITISIPELFLHHNTKKDFSRYDIIVRLLAIENYYGKNNYGFDFYRRMQTSRMGVNWTEPAVDRFRVLIKSYEDNGYDTNSEIELDANLHLLDGSHRMAMAVYHRCKTINAIVRNHVEDVFYGIEWFKINGFMESECNVLRAKYNEICNEYRLPFVCTLWHPAYPFFDEITNHLKLFGSIGEVKDLDLTNEEYKYYTRGIYAIDDIAKWKIEKKLSYMMAESTDTYHIRMITLYLDDPDFRLKDPILSTLSKKCELIKQLIRDSYKTKITNYFHDIIIHIGDNFLQNSYIYKLLSSQTIDVKTILDCIKPCDYVICKTDVDYMPEDFPIHYPFGKDIDIIARNEENYTHIKDCLIANTKIYKSAYDIRVIVDRKGEDASEYRTRIRLELDSQLVCQFDVSYLINNTNDGFSEEVCKDKINKQNFYIPTIEKEMMVRLCECNGHPEKSHHFEYVHRNQPYLNSQLCNKYLNFNWNLIIKNYENPQNHSGDRLQSQR